MSDRTTKYRALSARNVERLQGKRLAELTAAAREELDQSPAWWEGQYRALVREAFVPKPFDITEHEGHEIIAEMRYLQAEPTYHCVQCRTEWVPRA